MAITKDAIDFSTIANNHYIVSKSDSDDISITLSKHEVVKSINTLDTKIYNAFISFYYALMIGDSNAFYQSIDGLSVAMKNHVASKTTIQPMTRRTAVDITPMEW